MATTLQNLIDRARSRADMINSDFVDDTTELTPWANAGLMELYDLVVRSFEDYFTTSTTSTITTGNTISLPATFYKLRALDYSLNGSYVNVPLFNFQDRNKVNNGLNWNRTNGDGRAYRIMADNILIQNAASAAGTYQIWYVPSLTPLSALSDAIPTNLSKFGWDEYIVLYMAERMLSKEESSIADVNNARGELVGRISAMAADRQIEQPETIADTQGAQFRGTYEY